VLVSRETRPAEDSHGLVEQFDARYDVLLDDLEPFVRTVEIMEAEPADQQQGEYGQDDDSSDATGDGHESLVCVPP